MYLIKGSTPLGRKPNVYKGLQAMEYLCITVPTYSLFRSDPGFSGGGPIIIEKLL